MKIYYAHCKAIYSTLQEKRDIETLTRLGFEVVNPGDPSVDAELDKISKDSDVRMEWFKQFATSCDAIAFRGLPASDLIPAGVAKEIAWFRELEKPVIEMPTFCQSRTMTVEATREYLKELGQR